MFSARYAGRLLWDSYADGSSSVFASRSLAQPVFSFVPPVWCLQMSRGARNGGTSAGGTARPWPLDGGRTAKPRPLPGLPGRPRRAELSRHVQGRQPESGSAPARRGGLPLPPDGALNSSKPAIFKRMKPLPLDGTGGCDGFLDREKWFEDIERAFLRGEGAGARSRHWCWTSWFCRPHLMLVTTSAAFSLLSVTSVQCWTAPSSTPRSGTAWSASSSTSTPAVRTPTS